MLLFTFHCYSGNPEDRLQMCQHLAFRIMGMKIVVFLIVTAYFCNIVHWPSVLEPTVLIQDSLLIPQLIHLLHTFPCPVSFACMPDSSVSYAFHMLPCQYCPLHIEHTHTHWSFFGLNKLCFICVKTILRGQITDSFMTMFSTVCLVFSVQ